MSKILLVVNYIQILYLCILKQPKCETMLFDAGCELHSNLVSLHSETTLNYRNIRYRSCELHSNLVSLHSETTITGTAPMMQGLWITFKSCIFAFWNNIKKLKLYAVQLWITFKSCIFAFWNNVFGIYSLLPIVVNYIQILYLCILKQLTAGHRGGNTGCELHSNLVSLHSETTCTTFIIVQIQLWITFKSCIFAFWNNGNGRHCCLSKVVNYIQILYLCILKQPNVPINANVPSCELHSNLVSLHSETTHGKWYLDNG